MIMIFVTQGAKLMIDHCGSDWSGTRSQATTCMTSLPWPKPDHVLSFGSSGILQVGGMAHKPPRKEEYGWKNEPISDSLQGCVSHLRINDEVSLFKS